MQLEYWHVACIILIPGILLASWIDYSQKRVPNRLNLALIIVGLMVQGWFFGMSGIGTGLLGLLTGFGLLIVPWLMHGMGAGDVKLLAAIGVFLGPELTLYAFMGGTAIGGIIAVIMIVSTGRTRMALGNMSIIFIKCWNPKTIFSDFGSAKSFGNTSQLLPYGVPLTGGTLLVLAAIQFNWWGM